MKRGTTIVVALLTLALVACEPEPAELILVKPLDVTRDYEIAKDFLELIDRESTVTIEFTETAMTELDAVEALIAGEADIALVSNSLPFRRRIATVLPMYPTVLHIGFQAGRDSTDGHSLMQGARIYAGEAGSASRLMFDSVRSRLQLSTDDFSYVDRAPGNGDLGAFPDVFVVFAPIAADNLESIPPEIRAGLRLLSLGEPEDIGKGSAIDSVTLLNPHFEPFLIPVGTYGTVTPEPVLTLAVDMLLVARANLDETVVYDLVQEVLRLKPALAALRPGLFNRLSDHIASGNSTFVLHPGLVAYEQRDAPTIYERYSGVAEVVFSLIFALISATFAATRMYKFARKNRIDTFYAKVMEIRNAMADFDAGEQRENAVTELRALQTNAFEQLIDEKLAADESFRIFIALSNDVIGELQVGKSA
ncbi:MAG: TRAP-type uncharacterized transport system substrate-binding protein [Woeseiaceae bacterium]|jgi:TRAP-type uncharacterized transport system substrate-binding protein